MDVAEPAAGDEQRRVGDLVDCHDSLDFGAAGTEIGFDGGNGDVHNERVGHEHELSCDENGKRPPAAWIKRGN